ncbi:MAG TPA: DNA recombination protein RmuC [Gaiellaceae bacterium]|nr:DNA recombination protein RmuC [Gaiellaceae bacterium]
MSIAAFLVGALLGGVAVWLVLRERLRAHRRTADELTTTFTALSAEALHRNNDSFLQLASTQLKPIAEKLKAFDEATQQLDRERQRAYGTLTAQVKALAEGQERLRIETGSLRTALRAPHVRGRWGEIQLRRVVELAGMLAHCDFDEQKTATDADGHVLRPDLVVKLPGGKRVVVDAKAPLAAYLDALEAEDEHERRAHLQIHARQVRDHITKLGAKRYWLQFEPAPEFVIMFLPDETFFRVACEADADLLELGPESGVLPSSPTTLIGLLKVFAYAWQQETIAEDAREIASLGRELYERLGVFASHFSKVGRALDTAVGAYNQATGSLERRLLVTARKFEEHGAAAGPTPTVEALEKTPVPLTAAELTRAESVQPQLPPAADAA